SPALRFAPGYAVFPGGALDPLDGSPEALALLDGWPARPPAVAGVEVTPAHVVSAVRECFEEAGVLLARDPEGRPVHADPARAGSLARLRRAVQDEGSAAAFFDALRRERLRMDGGALRYFGHWVTHSASPIRFDTRFFAAPLPDGAAPVPCAREVTEGGWWRPADALAAFLEGYGPVDWERIMRELPAAEALAAAAAGRRLALLPPTEATLRFLAAFDSLGALLAHLDDGTLKLEGLPV
ncbi:MAG TPA: hypothetical protein VNM66_00560, partial [Thermodesulfobacteriota bacterium]|nr:hypothetical protein [Thermodesulfobacteriota bacterium]